MLLLSSVDLTCFLLLKNNNNKQKKNTRVSNGLDTDQDRLSVGPDLGPNYLQRLSADDKSHRKQ